MNKPNCCEKCLKIDYSSDTNVPLCNNLSCECHKVNASIKNCEKKSHYHCWNQTRPSACGIPLAKHTQCCLCDTKYDPTPSHHTWEKRFALLWGEAPPNSLKGKKGNEIKAFIAKIESDAIARTVQDIYDKQVWVSEVDIHDHFFAVTGQSIQIYAKQKGITINDTTI